MKNSKLIKTKIRIAFVKATVGIAFFIMLFCLCAFDTEGTHIFRIGLIASLSWLVLFCIANGYYTSIEVRKENDYE